MKQQQYTTSDAFDNLDDSVKQRLIGRQNIFERPYKWIDIVAHDPMYCRRTQGFTLSFDQIAKIAAFIPQGLAIGNMIYER